MDEPITSTDTATRWRQVSLWCRGWQAAEQMAVTGLAPHLVNIEREQTITSWPWPIKAS